MPIKTTLSVFLTHLFTLSFQTESLTEPELTDLARVTGQEVLAILLFLPPVLGLQVCIATPDFLCLLGI